MKSLLCSDIHDHVKNFESCLMLANTANCDSVICCGDLCAPFVLDIYNAYCNLPLHVVFGNNDGDRFHLNNKASQLNTERKPGNSIHLHGEYLIMPKGHSHYGIPSTISLGMTHYPEIARLMADSGQFNLVCCGHSHKSSIEKVNECLLINPGSIMGYIPEKPGKHIKPTCIIINWETGELELLEL